MMMNQTYDQASTDHTQVYEDLYVLPILRHQSPPATHTPPCMNSTFLSGPYVKCEVCIVHELYSVCSLIGKSIPAQMTLSIPVVPSSTSLAAAALSSDETQKRC